VNSSFRLLTEGKVKSVRLKVSNGYFNCRSLDKSVKSAAGKSFQAELRLFGGCGKLRPFLTAGLKICGSNSVVECQLPKLDVAGSSPVSRFTAIIKSHLKKRKAAAKFDFSCGF
jgi:hypothetical protein